MCFLGQFLLTPYVGYTFYYRHKYKPHVYSKSKLMKAYRQGRSDSRRYLLQEISAPNNTALLNQAVDIINNKISLNAALLMKIESLMQWQCPIDKLFDDLRVALTDLRWIFPFVQESYLKLYIYLHHSGEHVKRIHPPFG